MMNDVPTNHILSIRRVLRTPGFILLIAMAFSLSHSRGLSAQDTAHPPTDVYEGWRLGMQAWTFNKYTFYEAIEKTAALGVDWIEAYPGQMIGDELPGQKFSHELSPAARRAIKERLAGAGIRLVNYGVVGLPNDEAESRKVFNFARDMGIETLTSEPKEEALDLIEGLCKEFGIRVAIHNHPKPSPYWNPDKILEVSRGRTPLIGSCADIGHWMRSGIDPVEAIKKLKDRVISLHFGDLNAFGDPKAHDVAWGTGTADIEGILSELHKLRFKGVFSIEFEYDWYDSMPEIRQSITYFNKLAARLKSGGWYDLLDPELAKFTFKPGSWSLVEGELTWHGGSYIWTKEKYGNFVLDLEFKLDKNTNSGVFVRAGSLADFVQSSIEVQIHETTDGSKYGACGAIYDCLAPSRNVVRRAGEWNHYTITCRDNFINVISNGTEIINMDLNKWTKPRMNPDGTPNKFKTALKDMPRVGYIGLQDHGQPIWFRNIRIKTLD